MNTPGQSRTARGGAALLLAAVSLALAACGADPTPTIVPDGTPATATPASSATATGVPVPPVEGVSKACLTSFAEQAAPALPSEDGFVAILHACPTLNEIVAADQAIPGALDGIDPAGFVENYCHYYPEAAGALPCQ